MDKAKPFCIAKRDVWEAYKRVKANQGAAGVDGVSIADFEQDLANNLYRIWNRMSSGSYFPQAVRRVDIPKGGGRTRPLGISTVSDRIAQTVVQRYLEPILEPVFHKDSYGYRPGRSAHDALAVARQRCWRHDWVLDLDVRNFLETSSYCPHVHEMLSNRSGWLSITLIRRPLRRPLVTSTASSSPRFTRCNTVWRETPSFIVVSSMGRYSGGASSTKRVRNSSVMRICQGALGVICSPAMKPSLSHRCIVEVLIPRIFAACRMDASSPADCSVGG